MTATTSEPEQPEGDFVRVRLANGMHVTLRRDDPAAKAEGIKVLAGHDTVDHDGRPLPSKTAPLKASIDYSKLKKAELQSEIEKRNADRADDEQIVVPATATNEHLVEALQADDGQED